MNNHRTLAMFAIVVSGLVGVVGTLNGFGMMFPQQDSAMTASAPFEGHFTVTAKHPDGSIYAYQQTDNTVTQVGKICVAVIVFGQNNSGTQTHQCGDFGSGTPNRFQFIAMGAGTTASADTQKYLDDEREGRVTGSIGATNSSATTVPAMASISGTKTIANATSSYTINEVGLFDKIRSTSAGTPDGHMFARQKLTTGIPVNNNDQITFKWQINLG